jgi:hypothetical protein
MKSQVVRFLRLEHDACPLAGRAMREAGKRCGLKDSAALN